MVWIQWLRSGSRGQNLFRTFENGFIWFRFPSRFQIYLNKVSGVPPLSLLVAHMDLTLFLHPGVRSRIRVQQQNLHLPAETFFL